MNHLNVCNLKKKNKYMQIKNKKITLVIGIYKILKN